MLKNILSLNYFFKLRLRIKRSELVRKYLFMAVLVPEYCQSKFIGRVEVDGSELDEENEVKEGIVQFYEDLY
jgi:hypothetical protein